VRVISAAIGLFLIGISNDATPPVSLMSQNSLVLDATPRGPELTEESEQGPLPSDQIGQLMAEAAKVPEMVLSPDGRWVLYTVATGAVADNVYTTELWLRRTDAELSAPSISVAHLTSGAPATFSPRWRPGTEAFSYFDEPVPPTGPRRLVQYTLSTGMRTVIEIQRAGATSRGDAGGYQPTNVSNDYQWLPAGLGIAFTAPARDGDATDPRRGRIASLHWTAFLPKSPTALFVLDVATGVVERLSPDSMHVHHFDWAPNERSVVVSATPDAEGNPTFRTDLFVIDRVTRAVRPLVVQPGLDDGPRWSPDGRWIAFSSRFGEPTTSAGWAAVIPAHGGAIIRLGTADDPLFSPGADTFWTSDSQSLYFSARHEMSRRLFRADLSARRVTQISTNGAVTDSSFSPSEERHLLAFVRESPIHPPEVFVQTLPSGTPRPLTRLSADFPLGSTARIENVAWPSHDGKFTIHGLLLTPRRAWHGDDEAARLVGPLPTLVFLTGGPAMVVRAFAPGEDGGTGQLLPMVARGYAVLAPNTRGRDGYGQAFLHGMRDGRSAGRLPYEDMIGGVELLIKRGIADPARLGIYGHSYGAYLTAYTLTQTSRFRAAMIHEMGVVEWLTAGIWAAAPGTDWSLLHHELYGIQNVYDADERQRLIAESPGLNADRTTTPTLLQFGAKANADHAGRLFFSALQRFHVPAEFAIYDEGHGFVRPAAVAASHACTADWFDYWLRDQEDGSVRKVEQYDRWRTLRRANRAQR
jgi:dipeptidyl aminopeptidase/acylaminoacyl peptidase